MFRKLFSSQLFAFTFLCIVALDLVTAINDALRSVELISVIALKWSHIALSLTAFISFFLVTKFSLRILQLFILLRMIAFPGYLLLQILTEVLLYGNTRVTLEICISLALTVIIGIVLFLFYNKYKIRGK